MTTFQSYLNKIFAEARQKNMTARNYARKLIQDAPARRSALVSYIQTNGKTNDIGPKAIGEQAGKMIIAECSSRGISVDTIMQLDPTNIPGTFRNYKFYPLLAQHPTAFCCAFILGSDSVSNAQGEGIKSLLDAAGAASTGNVSGVVKSGGKTLQTAVSDLKNLFAKKAGSDLVDVFEFWKAGAGQVNEGRAVYSKFTKDYFNKAYRPDIEKNPFGLSYEQIAAVWPKYAALLPQYDRAGKNLNNLLEKIYQDNYTPDKIAASQQKSGSENLPEIGKVKTPWGNIEWGVTNNKAILTGVALAALAIIAIVYFTRKK